MLTKLIKATCDFCLGHCYYEGHDLETAKIYFIEWDWNFNKEHVFCSNICQENYQEKWEKENNDKCPANGGDYTSGKIKFPVFGASYWCMNLGAILQGSTARPRQFKVHLNEAEDRENVRIGNYFKTEVEAVQAIDKFFKISNEENANS